MAPESDKQTKPAHMVCLHEHDWGVFETKLDTILAEVRRTNGRLRALERWRTAAVTGILVLMAAEGHNLFPLVAKWLMTP